MNQAVQSKDEINVAKMQKLPIIRMGADPTKKLTEKEEKWLREVSTYEFMNLEEPGLMASFAYGAAGNMMSFKLFHGAKYQLPRFIARHIESKATPIWNWRPDGLGGMHKERVGEKSRFQLREVYE